MAPVAPPKTKPKPKPPVPIARRPSWKGVGSEFLPTPQTSEKRSNGIIEIDTTSMTGPRRVSSGYGTRPGAGAGAGASSSRNRGAK